jgi:hypothetical protein
MEGVKAALALEAGLAPGIATLKALTWELHTKARSSTAYIRRDKEDDSILNRPPTT